MIKMSSLDSEIKEKISSIPIFSRIAFLATFLFGLIIHMPIMTNLTVNHDSVFFSVEYKPDLTAGRWFRVLIGNILSGKFQNPWLIGITALFMFSLCSAEIVYFFQIDEVWQAVAISGLLISFPTVAGNYSYTFATNEYPSAFFLALSGVLLVFSKKRKNRALGIVCFILSCAIYQIYIEFAILLIIMQTLLYLFFEKDLKQVMIRAIQQLMYIAFGMVCYYIITFLISRFHRISLQKRTMNIQDPIETAVVLYRTFIKNILFNKGLNGEYCANYFLLVLLAMTFIVGCRKLGGMPSAVWRIIIYTGVYLTTPLLLNLLCFVTGPDIHNLMEYPMVLLWIYPVLFIRVLDTDRFVRIYERTVLAVLLFAIYGNIIFTSSCYYGLLLEYQNSFALANRLVSRIETTDGWDKEMPVMFVGSIGYHETIYDETIPTLRNELKTVTGYNNGNYAYVKPKILRYFINDYIGAVLKEPTEEQENSIFDSGIIDKMDTFPERGSIRIYQGTLIIKLTNDNIRDLDRNAYEGVLVR